MSIIYLYQLSNNDITKYVLNLPASGRVFGGSWKLLGNHILHVQNQIRFVSEIVGHYQRLVGEISVEMGKSQEKKRKKENQSVSHSESSDTMAVSSILGEANEVLYDNPAVVTSTPLVTHNHQQSVSPQNLQNSDTYPPWARDLVSAFGRLECKVNGMHKKLEKLESVESKVVNISATISNFESELTTIKSSLESSLQQTKEMINTVSERTDGLEYQYSDMEERITQLESENKTLKWEIVDVKARSMRDNLIFSNIPEVSNETPITTEAILREFMVKELRMDTAEVGNIKFDRVHRMAGRNQPRAIVAKFNNFKQRQDVKFKSKQLKGTNFYINEQFPPEINEQRRLLINIAKEKQRQGHKTRLVYNKLYVDGTPYNPPTYPRDHGQRK
jgi:hypothetical protein